MITKATGMKCRSVPKKVPGALLLAMVFTLFPILCEGQSSAVVEQVYMHSEEDMSRVEIRLSRWATYKVIPLEDRELVVAIKDAGIDKDVFDHEVILGDPFVMQIQTEQKPSHVASVVIQLSKSLKDIAYRVERRGDALHLELRDISRVPQSTVSETKETSNDTASKALAVRSTERKPFGESKGSISKDSEPKTPDERLLRDAEREMGRRNWQSALVTLEELVDSYPESPYREDAQFLLAACYHKSHLETIQEHLFEITERYQAALNSFPKSRLVPRALVSMGNAYLAADRHYEAMSNYDRVLEEFSDDSATAEAMFQRGLVYSLTKKPLLALREFDKVTKRFPNSPFTAKAMLEEGKTLFHIKSFKRSLKVLSDLRQKDANLAEDDPHVLLYEGYNYYELGQLQEARDAFSQALNLFPDLEATDLLLTRIADTYREDGMEDKASKLYDLVARTYPLSEGSLISLLRIAEGLEDVGISEEPEDGAEKNKDEMASKRANDIYQQIIDRAPESPLAQVAMLKLATYQKKNKRYEEAIGSLKKLLAKEPNHKLKKQVYESLQDAMFRLASMQKEDKEFENSVETLSNLLSDFPDTYLKGDIQPVLEESLTAVFLSYQQLGNPERLIKYYERLKSILPFDQMPAIMLSVADAYKSLHLYGHAYGALLEAKTGMGEKAFPPEDLLSLAECAYEERELVQAKKSLRDFISTYPTHKDIPVAHFWLGKVHLRDEDYETAFKALRAALLGGVSAILEPEALFAMAEAASGQGKLATAAETLEKATSLVEKKKGNSTEDLFSLYRRLGEVYSSLGQKEQAVEVFEKAVKVAPAGSAGYSLQYQLAQCYQELKEPKKAEKLLKAIEAAGDPFWSKLARVQMEEITIGRSAQRLGLGTTES